MRTVAVALVLLSGCAGPPPSAAPHALAPRAEAGAAAPVTSPSTGIAPLAFGMTEAAVREALGEPGEVSFDAPASAIRTLAFERDGDRLFACLERDALIIVTRTRTYEHREDALARLRRSARRSVRRSRTIRARGATRVTSRSSARGAPRRASFA